jgi:ABC-type nitrate/sulfonate/bicarbonate transport system permease component
MGFMSERNWFDTRAWQKTKSGLFILLFFVIWELACIVFGVKEIILPRPTVVMGAMWQFFPGIRPHLIQTLYTTLVGFGLGVVIGVLLGMMIGVSRTAYDTAYPLLVGFSSIPKVAVVPIFVLWFGAGTTPAILTSMVICVFPIVVNVATGLATTEPELEDVLKSLGASKLDILWNVSLPRAMPYFFASLKVAITRGSSSSRSSVSASTSFSPSSSSVSPVGPRASRTWRWPERGSFLSGDRFQPAAEERPNRELQTMFNRRHFTAALMGAAMAFTGASSALAQDVTKIKFTLDWKFQAMHSWYYLAIDKGYFAAEKLDVTVDQGEGSAATVNRIMSGAYDAGFGDVNAIIQNASTKPAEAPVMVYMIYNQPPFGIVLKANSPIKTPKDLEGKKLGGPTGSATTRLFPVFAKLNGIDASKVEVLNMAPNLQEQMLVQDQVHGSMIFTATSYMNLVGMKLDPDKDFRWMNFGDYGVDIYSWTPSPTRTPPSTR